MITVHDGAVSEVSQPFVGRWNRLISQTNWEKGRIIYQWREDLKQENLSASEYSDEAWTRLVGGVSSQHAGRLRRVYERFDAVRDQYDGLYWSHFQAALDWEDAEMWLEGAVQNEWSVSSMRKQRHEALGAPEDLKPRDEDIIVGELDEDFGAANDPGPADAIEPTMGVVQPPVEADDENEALSTAADGTEEMPRQDSYASQTGAADNEHVTVEPLRPFEDLPSLPDDVQEACEQFKLAILHHKLAAWSEVSPADLVQTLDALKALVTAPSQG